VANLSHPGEGKETFKDYAFEGGRVWEIRELLKMGEGQKVLEAQLMRAGGWDEKQNFKIRIDGQD
jgi:hypothetical protein